MSEARLASLVSASLIFAKTVGAESPRVAKDELGAAPLICKCP